MLRPQASPSKWLTLFATCLGLGMLMVDTFVVNVAFPAITRTLNADLSRAEWTVSGYVMVTAVFPIAMGRIGDIFGRKRMYMAGLVVFVFASLLCGAAQSIEQLIAARLLQGFGAAIMMPLTLSIITHAFPPEQRGLAIGIWGGVSGLGLIAGPILGGLLVSGDSWRWIFYVNLPLGLIGVVMAYAFIRESRDESAPRSVDIPGLVLLAGALFTLMFAVTRGNAAGWGSPLIVGCFLVGFALLPVFILVELRRRHPLVDLSLFRSGPFVMASLSAMLFSAAVFGSQPFTSLYMQNFMGFSPLEAGFAFLPATALVAALMPLSGIIGQRLGHRLRLIVIAGSISVALSFLYLLRLDVDDRYVGGLLPAFLLRGLGIGLVMSATSLAVMSAVPMAKSGLASGTLTMSRNIGTALGVAIFGAVFLQYVDSEVPARLTEAGVTGPAAVEVTESSEHMVPAGEGAVLAISRQAIVDGFVRLAQVGVVISLVAAAAAFFIRYRRPASVPAPEPSPPPRPQAAAATTASDG